MGKLRKATFGAGCFWGVEDAFRRIDGVVSTRVGYMGGHMEDPSYEDVCTGLTGHAEVVEVTFDPDIVSYSDLLDVFWSIHDPTSLNRQGPDVGEQYRSVIFYHDEEQRRLALRSRDEVGRAGRFSREIVTAIEPAGTFYEAEEYHQQYLEKNPRRRCYIRRMF
ncbi:MAG: peptide-methionine (S)-S-oxide reductase MsrA [Methanothermobacter wolfeii]|nr:peptide-methionine (S)-S-oxide reductase MsrA [Methanothermobacter wolfeii]